MFPGVSTQKDRFKQLTNVQNVTVYDFNSHRHLTSLLP